MVYYVSNKDLDDIRILLSRMIKKKLARTAGFFLFLMIFAIELFGMKL